jgi:predicted alternative tryptophan synthase beta-subunit
MALDTSTLTTTIQNALKANVNQSNADADAKAAAEAAANNLGTTIANAIETFVKSGEVSFSAGSVTGSTPANGTLTGGTASGGTIS